MSGHGVPPDLSFFDVRSPDALMSDALYASCAEVLSVCQANKDDLDALLNPESGFAPRLRDICYRQCVYPPSIQDAR